MQRATIQAGRTSWKASIGVLVVMMGCGAVDQLPPGRAGTDLVSLSYMKSTPTGPVATTEMVPQSLSANVT